LRINGLGRACFRTLNQREGWGVVERGSVALPDEWESLLERLLAGDPTAREGLLTALKPFAAGVAARHCQRVLTWGQDDELSVAFLALNEALDRFDAGRGIPFLAFARLVIKSRLNDFLRREAKRSLLESMTTAQDGPELENPALVARAWEQYLSENEVAERAAEIAGFSQVLARYGLSFEELVRASPRHRDTRRTLQQCAVILARRPELMTALKERGRLPIGDLQKATGVPLKTLERGRKYIVALALLLDAREEFVYLYEYVRGIWKGGGDHGAGNRSHS